MSPREDQSTIYDDQMLQDDETEVNIDTTQSQQSMKAVTFGMIEIREYNRIVGDHPDVKVGPPISIGWDFFARDAVPIDEYEAKRPPKRVILRLTSITRKNILRNVFEIPEKEILSAEKEIQRIQKQRERSVKQSKVGAQVEDAIKSRTRGLRYFAKDVMFKGLVASTQSMMPVYAGM
jgi:hypothetical protein